MIPALLLLLVILLVTLLVWTISKRFASERLQFFSDGRRRSSQLVSRGEFFDGSRHRAVALALTDQVFYYENTDMQASLERHWIQEIEYDNELSTGQAVGDRTVLRLRCFSQMFEFVLPADAVRQWKLFLPPHRLTAASAV